MYEFIQPNDKRSSNFTSSIKTIFNEINLDDNIQGFRTLTVSGRALIGRDINTIKIPGSYQEYVTENRVASREIGVKFLLQASSDEELRARFNHLNQVLHTTEIKRLYFTDESYHFNVILASVSDIEETSNTILASIKFKCVDPHKYKLDDKNITINGTGQIIRNLVELDTVPHLIEYRPIASTSRIVITNATTNKRIVIIPSGSTSSLFKITLLDDIILKKNEIAMSKEISFTETDFDFSIKNGDSISISPAGTLKFVVKERLL